MGLNKKKINTNPAEFYRYYNVYRTKLLFHLNT